MLELTATEVHDTVYREYIAARGMQKAPKPLLFLGPSGVGKTVSVRTAAKSIAQKTNEEYIDYSDFCGLSAAERERLLEDIEAQGRKPFFFVDVMLLSHEPADFSGIPRESEIGGERVTKFIPMEWAALLRKYPGVVFLDEMTNVNRDDLRGVAYKIVDERRTGSIMLSSDVQVVAAGNRPNDSSIAMPLPAPLLNRMAVYHVGVAPAGNWYRYASEKHPQADAFLLGYLSKLAATPEPPDAPETSRQFATPRSCEYLLEREMSRRVAFGEEVSASEMNHMAVSTLGGKEGELLAGWWSRRKEMVSFLSNSQSDTEKDASLSPAALWAAGIYAGRVANEAHASKDSTSLHGLDATIKENMGPIVRNITKHGKEYAVPVYLGMGAFAKGSDPRESACKVASVVGKMHSGNAATDRMHGKKMEERESPELVRAYRAFRETTPAQYFSGEFARTFSALSSGKKDTAIERFVSVGERLLADQVADALRKLEKIKEVRRPLAEDVGDDFAKSIVGFDSVENWEKTLEASKRGSGQDKAVKKGNVATRLVTQATQKQQRVLSCSS